MNNLKDICKLIQDFMELQDGDVYIYNQKYILPNDTGLKICVGLQGENILSNYQEVKNEKEYFKVIKQCQISIDIYSYDNSALKRKEEILMALNSCESENLQDKKSFHIARVPTNFTFIGELEGTKILNRYNILFNIINGIEKIKDADYYNKGYIKSFINQ